MIFGKTKDQSETNEKLSSASISREACAEKIYIKASKKWSALPPEYNEILIEDFLKLDHKSLQVVTIDIESNALSEVSKLITELRIKNDSENTTGFPCISIRCDSETLCLLGERLHTLAEAKILNGTRILLNQSLDFEKALSESSKPYFGPSVLRMPMHEETTALDASENTLREKFVYCLSEKLRETARFMAELAENNMERVYLLGAPGTGKTSLAYHFFTTRGKGRFVAVNLNSESINDKQAMKSLLCGHVAGAYQGASTREGAFSFAGEGVVFLDESHGVSGEVMQVLMEALDSGQYLPFGATKKRRLQCGLIFASNRSWQTLMDSVDLDEHTRLAATILELPPLKDRPIDIAVASALSLAKHKGLTTKWTAPLGIDEEAYALLNASAWNGNIRAVLRVIETACVDHARKKSNSSLLNKEEIQKALTLWEPEQHPSLHKFS